MPPKLLIIDDSKTVRTIVRNAFKTFDCELIEVASALDGFATVTRENPALILLDVTMPVIDGLQVLLQIKADPALATIPLIMLVPADRRDEVLRVGVKDFLLKPFTEILLREKVRCLITLQPASGIKPATPPVFAATG